MSNTEERKETKGIVLTMDEIHQPWHIIFPGDPDYVSPYPEKTKEKSDK